MASSGIELVLANKDIFKSFYVRTLSDTEIEEDKIKPCIKVAQIPRR